MQKLVIFDFDGTLALRGPEYLKICREHLVYPYIKHVIHYWYNLMTQSNFTPEYIKSIFTSYDIYFDTFKKIQDDYMKFPTKIQEIVAQKSLERVKIIDWLTHQMCSRIKKVIEEVTQSLSPDSKELLLQNKLEDITEEIRDYNEKIINFIHGLLEVEVSRFALEESFCNGLQTVLDDLNNKENLDMIVISSAAQEYLDKIFCACPEIKKHFKTILGVVNRDSDIQKPNAEVVQLALQKIRKSLGDYGEVYFIGDSIYSDMRCALNLRKCGIVVYPIFLMPKPTEEERKFLEANKPVIHVPSFPELQQELCRCRDNIPTPQENKACTLP